jgi:hypothetical protein
MGGVLPNYYRDLVNQELRDAASRVIRWRKELHEAWANGDYRTEGNAAGRLRDAVRSLEVRWREFPECERDKAIPSPEEILKRCDAMDRQKEEHDRYAARGATS